MTPPFFRRGPRAFEILAAALLCVGYEYNYAAPWSRGDRPDGPPGCPFRGSAGMSVYAHRGQHYGIEISRDWRMRSLGTKLVPRLRCSQKLCRSGPNRLICYPEVLRRRGPIGDNGAQRRADAATVRGAGR